MGDLGIYPRSGGGEGGDREGVLVQGRREGRRGFFAGVNLGRSSLEEEVGELPTHVHVGSSGEEGRRARRRRERRGFYGCPSSTSAEKTSRRRGREGGSSSWGWGVDILCEGSFPILCTPSRRSLPRERERERIKIKEGPLAIADAAVVLRRLSFF